MFSLTRPSERDIAHFLADSRDLPLSYEPVGLALTDKSAFRLDEAIVPLGSGAAAYERAKDALREWTHFNLGWVHLYPRRASIEPGTIVAVVIRHFGFWSINGCRVVYSVGSDTGAEFGFAYGTLTNHAEMGEEVFKVVLRPETREVQYVLRAASKPRDPLAKLGRPIVRVLQSRFRRDSGRAMQRAMGA